MSLKENLKNHSDSSALQSLIFSLYEKYKGTDERIASLQLDRDKWSIKEIFGHLCDSAFNNYQRFVRLQETRELIFPGYDPDWVKIVPYNSFPFDSLIELWKQVNLLLCHIIENIEDSSLKNEWKSENGDFSLSFLVEDYISHLKLHIDHLEKRVEEIQRD